MFWVRAAAYERFQSSAWGCSFKTDRKRASTDGLSFQLDIRSFCREHLHCSLSQDRRERKWRVHAVPVAPSSFECRKSLPVAWRGLRDEALIEVSGIPGCVFVHDAGFIGGNATREGAIAMARQGLTLE